MAGLKLRVCFWYLDPVVRDGVVVALKSGNFDVHSCQCKDRKEIEKKFLFTNYKGGSKAEMKELV